MARIHDFAVVLAKVRKSFHETEGMVDFLNSDKGLKTMVIYDVFVKSWGKCRKPEEFRDQKKKKFITADMMASVSAAVEVDCRFADSNPHFHPWGLYWDIQLGTVPAGRPGEEVSEVGSQTSVRRSDGRVLRTAQALIDLVWKDKSIHRHCEQVCLIHAHARSWAAVQAPAWKGSSWACKGKGPHHKDLDSGPGVFLLPGHGVVSLCPQKQNYHNCLHCQSLTGVPRAGEE